jgi:hypothetical protein
MMEKLALAEAEKAAEASKKHAVAEAEKKALLDKLTAPSGVADDERMKRAAAIIERAVANGLTEVLIMRFPNALCTDHGRAINQQEPGWEQTLTGLPKGIVRVLGPEASAARIQDQVPNRGLSRRDARRCRHHPEMGLNEFEGISGGFGGCFST